MVETSIQVRQLSKRYLLNRQGGYKRLTESVSDFGRHPLQSIKAARAKKEIFWALKDISFDVEKGGVLGVIGRNGAGKTTLLKIMSRITYPTEGEVTLHGRVGSLLEVGTGFHPELTGAENIFMNGAILGMRRREIEGKFDEIVKFAEIERFISVPVKKYSSGMYVRLAFSVAAHLEPEILLVDEVLAVGDAQFQKKCLGKMKDVSQSGRTILFVSHNMPAVQGLCESALLLSQGTLVMHGAVDKVVAEYLRTASFLNENDLERKEVRRRGDGAARFVRIELLDSQGVTANSVTEGKPFQIALTLRVDSPVDVRIISITFVDQLGVDIMTTMHYDTLDISELRKGIYKFRVTVAPNPFLRGTVNLRLACFGPNFAEYDHIHYAFSFNVVPDTEGKDAILLRPGIVNIPVDWHLTEGPKE